MAINKKLIHFKNFSDFNSKKLSANENNTQYTLGVDGEVQTGSPDILYQSICWIKDVKKIWTHGQYYDCNGGNGTSDSPTFLRIGDADDETKANFIAVANGEKSADYYICASSIQGAETNGIVSSLVYSGPTGAPEIVNYTFYGSPMTGGKMRKLLKINTQLTVATSEITTTYEDVLDAKQDTITDLETIREGAAKGATSVQSDDIATVATSGSYEDLIDKPVYITPFDVLSLYDLALNPDEVGGIQSSNQAISDALAANKIVLVPYAIGDDSIRGYATLVGYVEDLLYFKVITETYEIIVETVIDTSDILGQEVTLRRWNDKQDILISGANIKTINGNSILGSGDITIEGGSSSGSSAYSEVSHGTADTTFTLTPNTFHIWDEVSSLTLTLGSETSGVANEYIFQFTSGSTATTLSLPDDIKWTGGETPTIEANKIYQISILKGLGSVLEWDNFSLIENKLTLTDGDMMSGSVLTFAYPTASELTLTMQYYSSDTLIVPSGTTSITIDWFEPAAPQILSVNPASDNTYLYVL